MNISSAMITLMYNLCFQIFQSAGLDTDLVPPLEKLREITERVYSDASKTEILVMQEMLALQTEIDPDRILLFQQRATELFVEYYSNLGNDSDEISC
tara:strand:- start:1083 stop:1373 length:291 start_codon:yes stop_codon:yes gene_type:complete